MSLVTVVGLIVSLWQTFGALGEARRGNLIAQKANARATRQAVANATQTKEALVIAERQANIAEDTAARQLRAYVLLKSSSLGRCSDSNFPTQSDHAEQRVATLEYQNYGATPAYNVKSIFGAWIGPYPLVEPLSPIPENIERTTCDLAPGAYFAMPLEVINSGNMREGILAGGWAIYFWGEITYSDIYGEDHSTHISLVSLAEGYQRGSFQVALEGNRSD